MLGQQVAHLVGKGVGGDVHLVAAVEIEQVGARAHLAHQRVERGQERRVLVIPDHHVAVGAEQHRAERVVGVPELHVGAVGGIADVERIEHQQPAIAARDDMVGQPPPAIASHRGQVRQLQPRLRPFAESQPRRPDLDPVRVVRRAVAQGGPPAGVDLAAVAVMQVHRGLFRRPAGECESLNFGRPSRLRRVVASFFADRAAMGC